jgi:hypothetical protein
MSISQTRLIPLSCGQYVKRAPLGYAIVDECDYDWLSKFNWSIDRDGYAIRTTRVLGKLVRHKMHREILNAPSDKFVDHKNRIPFDNRRENLRLCSRGENKRNSRKVSGSSRFKGVVLSKGSWRAMITYDKKTRHIGTYDSEKEAALAYNVAASFAFREFANLNKI